MPTKKSNHGKSGHNASSRSHKSADRSLLIAAGAVVIVIVLIAAVWLSVGHKSGTTAPVTTQPVITGQSTVQGSSHQIAVHDLVAAFSAYNSPTQFTADYVGSVSFSDSVQSTVLTENIVAQYQQYNGSALSITSEQSGQPGTPNSTLKRYYFKNGTSYFCLSNSSADIYTCRQLVTPFNISTFGLSTFLTTLPGNYLQAELAYANSSYNGMPCLELSSTVSNSTADPMDPSVALNITTQVSGCIQALYKIPLQLNDVETGIYYNVSRPGQSPLQSLREVVNLNLVSLTNSSSGLQVENLPANAVILANNTTG